ncbi:hypothetical protein F4777DRAFT_208975 [Nemania sp. FL0916]|nr:hypothetical protein F4777DRAFT_208975 [Nemania sp. FL0916]
MRWDAQGIRWDLPLLLKILESLATIDLDLTVYIILDAMDESESEKLSQILHAMARLCAAKGRSIFRGLMTTRPLEKKWPKELNSFILTLEKKNENAINLMVDKNIQQIIDDIQQDDNSIELTAFDEIKQYIKTHADGVFLWVSMVIKEVYTLSEMGWTQSDLENLKTILPVDLKHIYKRMAARMIDNASSEIQLALGRKILACSAFSRRRLTLEEMGDAILVPALSESKNFEPNAAIFKNRIQRLSHRIAKVCGDLIEVKPPYVQLMHETVREFLLKREGESPFNFEDLRGKKDQASICLRYLRLSLSHSILDKAGIQHAHVTTWTDDDYGKVVRLLQDRPLLEYTISYLPQHLFEAKGEDIETEVLVCADELEGNSIFQFLVTKIWPPPADSCTAAQAFCDRALRVAAKTNFARPKPL